MATSLADLIRSDFGADFPISHGDGKRDDPLVITELRDYVSIEHVVSQHVLTMVREEFMLEQQTVSHRDGKVIDELVYAVKKTGAPQWTGRRRFFFDITQGYAATYS